MKRRNAVADTIRQLRKNKSAMIGLYVILFWVFVAIFAPFLAPYDPYEQSLFERLEPPCKEHPFGTDELGRDLLSRVIFGARISLSVGVIAVSISMAIGIPLGLISGYYGGTIDHIIMRLVDVLLAFPSILLAIAIMAVLGPSLKNAMVAVGIVGIPTFARLVRATVLYVKEQLYVEAARALGATDFTIMVRHILPNSLAPIIVNATLSIGTAILDAAGLGFLGLGAQPPLPEWGVMLSEARFYLLKAPWAITFPGIAILLTVLGFNLLGDGLRDALDPMLRKASE